MTPEEQFTALNTPVWLNNFRTKVSEIMTAFTTVNVAVHEFEFDQAGVHCVITPMPNDRARARIGTGPLVDLIAPIGWFRP